MSCWVVPSIAAELWGVSTESVLEAIHEGRIASKSENGFTFIDMAPDGPVMETAKLRSPPPPTYRVLTREEIVALVGQVSLEAEDDHAVEQWRQGRAEAGRIRRPPESQSKSDALAA